MEINFRPAKTQYLMTPPASTSSESDAMDIDEEEPVVERGNMSIFQFTAGGKEKPPNSQPAFRRRIGRLNRLWIDRRGLTTPPRMDGEDYSDRWKYDQDDEEETPVYEVDPYDTRALKFRATIPLSQYVYPRRQIPQEGMPNVVPTQVAGVSGSRPALPPPPQPQPQHAPQSQPQQQQQQQPQAPQAPPAAQAQAAAS